MSKDREQILKCSFKNKTQESNPAAIDFCEKFKVLKLKALNLLKINFR